MLLWIEAQCIIKEARASKIKYNGGANWSVRGLACARSHCPYSEAGNKKGKQIVYDKL
jgi:hypothetical protein